MKLAIIGCGAVTEIFHLPAVAANDRVELTALVDKSEARAARLADSFNAPFVASDHRDVLGRAEAAVVAVPNHLHASVSLDLLRQGVHLLVEKPMALTAADCEEMVATARSSDVVLAVGLIRRFTHGAAFVKSALEQKILGEVTGFDFREGAPYGWQVTSDAPFRKGAGGGLLADIGVHVLDLVLWWLGDIEASAYADDALGGVEAECELELTLESGVGGKVELSRTRELRNSYVIRGERGTLEVGTGANPDVGLHLAGQDAALSGQAIPPHGVPDRRMKDLFIRQLADFAGAVLEAKPPFVPGSEGQRSVQLIEACYAVRQVLRYPWVFPTGELAT